MPPVQPYHYGSHYSNSGTVLHFLVRLPPFTKMFLAYQGKTTFCFHLPFASESCLSNPGKLYLTLVQHNINSKQLRSLKLNVLCLHNRPILELSSQTIELYIQFVYTLAWHFTVNILSLTSSPCFTHSNQDRQIPNVLSYLQSGKLLEVVDVQVFLCPSLMLQVWFGFPYRSKF